MLDAMRPDAKSQQFDVLVVGAGPAGLFACLSLLAAGIEDIAVIDAGPDIDQRRGASDLSREIGWGHPDFERGVGGAGLFSDGKLCLSLDVGGHLDHLLADARRKQLLRQIDTVFERLASGYLTRRVLAPQTLTRLRDEAAKAGLGFKYYPVAHIGTDRCGDVIVALRELLEANGARFLSRTELVDLRVERRGHRLSAGVRVDGQTGIIKATQVVMAMGKVGAPQQARIARSLGIKTTSQPIYVGVRVETSAAQLEPIFAATKDPKYNALLTDGSKVKTHCASEQGEVIELRYGDLPLAGGHNYSHAQTERSGFSVLWDGLDHKGDAPGVAWKLMRQVARATDGRLLAQRLLDYRAGIATRQSDLDSLDLSCVSARAGDLRQVLPPGFFMAMDTLLSRLEGVVPGLIDETSIAYAPAIEWWMDRILLDQSFLAREVPGLAICGDGSGWSQGIVHAAATGLIAASGLHRKEVDVGHWLSERSLSFA